MDRPAVARAGRLLRRPRARGHARRDRPRRRCSSCSRSGSRRPRPDRAARRPARRSSSACSPSSPARGAGRSAPRPRRCRSSPACSGCSLDAARRGVRRRTLLVLPALVLWANLHGSVVLGAVLTMLLGGYALVRARRLEWLPLALLVLAPLCVLATPYGWDIVAYYELMLVDAPFAEILREWQWSSPSATTFLFYVLALVGRRPRRASPLPPPAERLRARRPRRDARRRRPGRPRRDLVRARGRGDPPDRARRALHAGGRRRAEGQSRRSRWRRSPASPSRSSSRSRARPWFFVSEWPEAQRGGRARRRRAIRDVRLVATDGTADWLLWRIPDLRGRIAYDVRFELYDERDARPDRAVRQSAGRLAERSRAATT